MENNNCQIKGHSQEKHLYLCLKQDCKYEERLFCQLCSQQNQHFSEDQQYVTLLSEINSQHEGLILNSLLQNSQYFLEGMSSLKQSNSIDCLDQIHKLFTNLKQQLIQEIEKFEKNVIINFSEFNIFQEEGGIYKHFINQIKETFQYSQIQTIIQDFQQGKRDFQQTQNDISEYSKLLNDQYKQQQILLELNKNTLLIKNQVKILHMVKLWVQEDKLINEIKIFQQQFEKQINSKSIIDDLLNRQYSHQEFEEFIKNSDPKNFEIPQSNLNFNKSTQSYSSQLKQKGNEFYFNGIDWQHIFSDSFSRQDKVLLKFKINNFQDNYNKSGFFFVNVRPNNEINNFSYYRNFGIYLSRAKATGYHKGQIKFIGQEWNQFSFDNSVLYLYISILDNLFVVLDENKKMICLKYDNSKDFEDQFNDWALIIGSYDAKIKIKILNIFAQKY